MSTAVNRGRNLAARFVPPIGRLRRQRDQLAHELRLAELRISALEQSHGPTPPVPMAFPPGHFYSPIPDVADVLTRADVVFDPDRELPGVEINAGAQLAWLARFGELYQDLPYPESGPLDGFRYRFDNPFFSYGDGIALYSMLRSLRPPRVVEVGSGWSSALMLDVNEKFLDGSINLTFVEPYPGRLHSVIGDADRSSTSIIEEPLHRAPRDLFSSLERGDVLFIDSTHVSKIGSDVNQLLLEIVPALQPGVHIHVHDVFFPFEYPRVWIEEGRSWNENYVLHALLIHNQRLRISWFNSYLASHHGEAVSGALPWWRLNPGGSIWLTVADDLTDHSSEAADEATPT